MEGAAANALQSTYAAVLARQGCRKDPPSGTTRHDGKPMGIFLPKSALQRSGDFKPLILRCYARLRSPKRPVRIFESRSGSGDTGIVPLAKSAAPGVLPPGRPVWRRAKPQAPRAPWKSGNPRNSGILEPEKPRCLAAG